MAPLRLRPSCRDVTQRVLQLPEQPLSGWDSVILRLHWLGCQGCRRFRQQAQLLQAATASWRRYRDGADTD